MGNETFAVQAGPRRSIFVYRNGEPKKEVVMSMKAVNLPLFRTVSGLSRLRGNINGDIAMGELDAFFSEGFLHLRK